MSTTSVVESTRLKEFYIVVAEVVMMDEVSERGCAKLKAYSLHIHTSLKLLGCGSFLIFVGGIVRYVRIAGSSGTRTGMVLRIFRNCARTQTYFSGVCTCCLQAACPATLRADLTVVGDCATGRVMRLTINFRELGYISTTGLISRHLHLERTRWQQPWRRTNCGSMSTRQHPSLAIQGCGPASKSCNQVRSVHSPLLI